MDEPVKITTRTCHPGEIIFREGDRSKEVFLIISGSVEISKRKSNNRKLINRLGGGEIFGEMGPLTNEPRYATVTAAEKTRLIVVNNKAFYRALINDRMPIIKPLALQLVQRLKDVEEQHQKSLERIQQLEDQLIKVSKH
jgi:CRP-like cAMP-binding protein